MCLNKLLRTLFLALSCQMTNSMNDLRIAIVEDDSILREELSHFLRANQLNVFEVNNGISLKELLTEQFIHLVILDLNLPGQNGLELATYIRLTFPEIRILMLTARTGQQDKIKGYDSGADIYITKPVSPAELLSAISSLTRRLSQPALATQWQLNLQTRQLISGGTSTSIDLTAAELALLMALRSAPDQSLDSEQLCQELSSHSNSEVITKRALENSISRLRKKLGPSNEDANAPTIRSVWGHGYQLCINLLLVNH